MASLLVVMLVLCISSAPGEAKGWLEAADARSITQFSSQQQPLAEPRDSGDPHTPGQAILCLKPSLRGGLHPRSVGGLVVTGVEPLDRLAKKWGVSRFERILRHPRPDRIALRMALDMQYLVAFDETADVNEVVADYLECPFVTYACPNALLRLCEEPDDSLYGSQWHLPQILCDVAWFNAHGDTSVLVTQIDVGVWWTHPDIERNLWVNGPEDINDNGRFDSLPAPDGDLDGLDQDLNGYADDVIGWDFYQGEPNPLPVLAESHGTHGWGLANAVTDNGASVAAPPWNVRGMALRCGSNSVSLLNAIAAIYYCVPEGIWTISMPFSGPNVYPPFVDACQFAWESGCCLTAAAGNENSTDRRYPAAQDNVIAVSASDRNDRRASFSNYGTWIDVCAPGVDMLSTTNEDSVGLSDGTSASCHIAAGALAWLKSALPGLDNDSAVALLENGCDSMPDPLYPEGLLGHGRINLVGCGLWPPYSGKLLTPDGGECWAGGDTQVIGWTIGPKDFLCSRLLLSSDGGLTFPDVVAESIAPTDTFHPWQVFNYNSRTCRIRLEAYDSSAALVMADASNRDFTIDSEPPPAPALVFPPEDGATNNPTVTFVWHEAPDLSGVARYSIQVAYDSGFVALVDSGGSPDTTYAKILPSDTFYFWRVLATDRAGHVGSWSEVWRFEIDAQIPGTPTLLEPVGGQWFDSTAVSFRWTEVAFQPKGKKKKAPSLDSRVWYVLQVDTTRDMASPLYTDTVPVAHDTLRLMPEGRYYWRVFAFDEAGNRGSYPMPDSFGIDISRPQTPHLIFPPHTSGVGEDTTSLIWHASGDNVSGVEFYHVQLARDSLYADTIALPSPTTPDTAVVCSLPGETDYYWHVRAKDYAGNWSLWSLTWMFSYHVGIAGRPQRLPDRVSLQALGPMPFTGSARFSLALPSPEHVRVEVFDATGQRLEMLADRQFAADVHDIRWNATLSSPGVYYLRVRVGDKVLTRRLVLAG